MQIAGLGIPVHSLRHKITGRKRHVRMSANVAATSSSLFLLHIASSSPSRRRSAMRRWSAARRIENDSFGRPRRRFQPRVSSQSGAVTLNCGATMRRSARAARWQGHEIERRIGHTSGFVAMRIVHFGHGVQGGDLRSGQQVDGGQVRDTAWTDIFQWNGGWTEDEDQRDSCDARPRCARASRNSDVSSIGPVVEANQDHVDAAGITGEQSGGIEQFLKDLVVKGRKRSSPGSHPRIEKAKAG